MTSETGEKLFIVLVTAIFIIGQSLWLLFQLKREEKFRGKFQLKPKQNTLVFFPGTLEFLHGVKPITNGVRYTLTSFWTYDKQQSILR
jgi:hypothetical protein